MSRKRKSSSPVEPLRQGTIASMFQKRSDAQSMALSETAQKAKVEFESCSTELENYWDSNLRTILTARTEFYGTHPWRAFSVAQRAACWGVAASAIAPCRSCCWPHRPPVPPHSPNPPRRLAVPRRVWQHRPHEDGAKPVRGQPHPHPPPEARVSLLRSPLGVW